MKNQALEDISKSLFTASEALREALDTADLEDIELGNWQAFLEGTMRILEMEAQEMQKEARKK